jgi:hypothetical protein
MIKSNFEVMKMGNEEKVELVKKAAHELINGEHFLAARILLDMSSGCKVSMEKYGIDRDEMEYCIATIEHLIGITTTTH